MATNYAGENAIRKLTELVLGELGKKQDRLDEITAGEVQQMWNDPNSELKEPVEEKPEDDQDGGEDTGSDDHQPEEGEDGNGDDNGDDAGSQTDQGSV